MAFSCLPDWNAALATIRRLNSAFETEAVLKSPSGGNSEAKLARFPRIASPTAARL